MALSKKPTLDLDVIRDRVDAAAREIAKHKINFTLNPDYMSNPCSAIQELSWSSVKYGLDNADTVPNDRRGVYAFVVSRNDDVLPPHGYVMYVGIGGKKSDRSLRKRYGDYLNTKKILKRDRIAKMIGTWFEVLHFAYAPVPDTISSEDLIALEEHINSALLPPFSKGDILATIKKKQRMFDG